MIRSLVRSIPDLSHTFLLLLLALFAARAQASPRPSGNGGVVQSCGPDHYVFCYPNNWDSTITYQSASSFPISVRFNSGYFESCCSDAMTVYDGLDTSAPILFSGSNGGNLSGLFFASTNPDHALTISWHSNFVGSCTQFSFAPMDWTVACLDCVLPLVSFATTNDCDNGQFFVTVNVTALGSDPVIDVTNDAGGPPMPINAPGMYQVGPFAFGTHVTVSLVNDMDTLCTVHSPRLTNAPCPIVSCGPDDYSYCYDDLEKTVFVYQSASAMPISLLFQSGYVDDMGDRIIIHDGLNQFAPVLYAGNGSGGDLSGLQFISTNPDHALAMELDMNSVSSCQDFEYPDGWSYTVACSDGCTSPEATFSVMPDCAQDQFYVISQVTDLGSAPSLTISNTGGAADVPVAAPGTYQSGPFPNGTPVEVTVESTSALCDVHSPSLVNTPCPIVSCGPDNYTYCYGNLDHSIFAYQSAGSQPLGILFQSGLLEVGLDSIFIYDGLNPSAPVLYQGSGVAGDLTGLLFLSTNADHALTIRLSTSGVYSCTDGYITQDMHYVVSCWDGCTAPTSTFELVEDCPAHQFYIASHITDLGSASALTITNSGGAPDVAVAGTGDFQSGPFPIGTPVYVTVESTNALCAVRSPEMVNGTCQVISCGPDNYTICYPDDWDSLMVYQSTGAQQVMVHFNAGTIEYGYDYITVYNGLNESAPVIYTGGGLAGDLSGLTFISSNPDHAMAIKGYSDDLFSCQDGLTGPLLDWTVSCTDCVLPAATFELVPDCIHNGYRIAVNVTDIGGSPIEIVNAYGHDTIPNPPLGITMSNLVPFGVPTHVSVEHIGDAGCGITSEVFNYASDSCIITACTPTGTTYCYGNADVTYFTYQSGSTYPITLSIAYGTMLVGDYIQVFNGPSDSSPGLYTGNNLGNLAGLAWSSNNPSNALTFKWVSDNAGSCQTGQTADAYWSVGCGLVGVEELTEQQLSLYPNPTTGELSINLPSGVTGTLQMDVVDITGRIVHGEQVNAAGPLQHMDLSRLQTGSYAIVLRTDHWSATRMVQLAR